MSSFYSPFMLKFVLLDDQEPRWQVRDIYTPVDAVAQGLKTLSLNDTRVLTRTNTDWFSQLEG